MDFYVSGDSAPFGRFNYVYPANKRPVLPREIFLSHNEALSEALTEYSREGNPQGRVCLFYRPLAGAIQQPCG